MLNSLQALGVNVTIGEDVSIYKSSKTKSNKTAIIIIGSVVGGIIFLAAVGLIAAFVMKL